MHRLDIAESALKVVGGLSILALLALLASPRRTPPKARDVRTKTALGAHPSSGPQACGDERNGCLRCCPGAECPCPNPAGLNVTYACRAGEPERTDGVCLSRSYARSDGKMYACWSCNPFDERAPEIRH